jgi:hypothetical protein
MITARRALLQKLRTVAPALASNGIVPGYTHFLFTGDSIVACNERIAIGVPQPGDYQGLVPPLLMQVLAGSTAPAVRIEADGEGVALVTLGDSVTKLPTCPEGYRFEMPREMPRQHVPAAFLHGVAHCIHSVSAYATVPEQLGVTLIKDRQDLRLFSTNRSTISTARVRWAELKLEKRVILSTAFCEQVLTLAKTAKTLRFDVYPAPSRRPPAGAIAFAGHALFAADDAVLYGKVIPQSDTPMDFVGVVKQHVPTDFARKSIAIPKGLPALVKRAAHLTSVIGSETKTTIVIENGMATVEALSERGHLCDRLAMRDHPDVEINVNARLLMEGLWAGPDRVLFTHRCAILARGSHHFLVAAFD